VLPSGPAPLRTTSLADVLGLLPGGRKVHVGCPDGVRIVDLPGAPLDPANPGGLAVGRLEVRPTRRLHDGVTYLLTTAEVVTHTVTADSNGLEGLLRGAEEHVALLFAEYGLKFVDPPAHAFTAAPPLPEVLVPQPVHTICTWQGVFGTVASPIEQWSFSIKTPPPADQDQAALDRVAGFLHDAWVTNIKPTMAESVVLTQSTRA
jgi:hypothetical protein